jgi:23S rRNA (adenine2030-N6)-methyltransferase
MNYRHDFHAGNFADVFKHIFLTRILLHLLKKPAPFRFIDTHAGSGSYDLFGTQAGKTAEWRMGLGRLLAAAIQSEALRELIDPYLRLAAPAVLEPPLLACPYPGSPAIAATLLRREDRMICCELHPAVTEVLRAHFARDRRAKIIEIDGFTGLNAFVPPVERRGLVLIDPPYEATDDIERSLEALEGAWRKWSTGIFMLWYPVKDRRRINAVLRRVSAGSIKRVLRLELQIADPEPVGSLAANGLLIVNPPFQLAEEARIILPFLAETLASSADARHKIEWLAPE